MDDNKNSEIWSDEKLAPIFTKQARQVETVESTLSTLVGQSKVMQWMEISDERFPAILAGQLYMYKYVATRIRTIISQKEQLVPHCDPLRQRWLQRQIKEMQETLVNIEETKQALKRMTAQLRRSKLTLVE